jgi:hypothetical protein
VQTQCKQDYAELGQENGLILTFNALKTNVNRVACNIYVNSEDCVRFFYARRILHKRKMAQGRLAEILMCSNDLTHFSQYCRFPCELLTLQ